MTKSGDRNRKPPLFYPKEGSTCGGVYDHAGNGEFPLSHSRLCGRAISPAVNGYVPPQHLGALGAALTKASVVL